MTGGETEPEPVEDVLAAESVRNGAHAAPRKRRRRTRTAVALTVLTVMGAGVAVAVPWKGESGSARTEAEPKTETAKVVRTDLTDTRTLDGVLGYGTPRTINGTGGGTVTWLASSGTTVSRGEPLYRVDDRPVPVFYGSVPMYRRLEVPNTVGRDVRVIADNLRALGYDIGRQPGPGETVIGPVAPTGTARSGGEGTPPGKSTAGKGDQSPTRPPDPPTSGTASPERGTEADGEAGEEQTSERTATAGRIEVRSEDGVLTGSLINAIKRWQTARGEPATGVIEAGDVVVLRNAVRVEGADVQPGDPADGALLRVTSATKAVTIEVDATEVGAVKRGDAVTVRLPDGENAAAKVAVIGTAAKASTEQGPSGLPRVTVTVTFKDPGKAAEFNSAPVQVEFGSETRTNVLAVPLTALLALREGGYGLQLSDGPLVAVRTGLIAKGVVEVSGDGITEGARVVTAS